MTVFFSKLSVFGFIISQYIGYNRKYNKSRGLFLPSQVDLQHYKINFKKNMFDFDTRKYKKCV